MIHSLNYSGTHSTTHYPTKHCERSIWSAIGEKPTINYSKRTESCLHYARCPANLFIYPRNTVELFVAGPFTSCVTEWMTENTKRPPLKVLLLATRVSLSQHKYYPNRYHPYRTLVVDCKIILFPSQCSCVYLWFHKFTHSSSSSSFSHVTH